ncbi:MAG: hypothetical protein GEU82_03220 [Luteitalea sp.]|nr:hypothetical protein [Luteitalea sp.]
MKPVETTRQSERGAVLIMVVVAMVALLAFGAFVIDYGVMWTGRGQVQTSADAGALSGAISLAFDSPTDFGGAQTKARAVARANSVWGQAPDVQLADVTFPACPPLAPGLAGTCVKVDAFRNQARGNPLPIYFGNLVGITAQGVRATATSQIVTGNKTDCLKPWAVVDRWIEFGPEGPGMLPTSTFDKYSDGKGQAPPQEADVYTPPSAGSAGTGFTLPADQGRRFAVKTAATSISSGWFQEILLPRADGHWTGGNVYRENIETCGGLAYAIAQPGIACPASIGQAEAAAWAAQGCFGVKPGGTTGPTRQGIEFLYDQDPGATYVPGTGIVGSSFSPPTASPRVVAIGVMDIDDYLSRNPTGSNGTVRLVNIYGFFVEGMGDVDEVTGAMTLNQNGKAVIGRLIRITSMGTGSSPLSAASSFLVKIILVR